MTSTYTSPIGLEKPGLNDYFNAWHTPANLQYDLIADAIAGTTTLTLTGDQTLSITDGADSDGRAHILNITSSDQHDRVITVPAVSKTFTVRNASSYRVKIKPTAGTATDIMPGTVCGVMVTATHCYRLYTSGWGLHSSVATTSGTTATFTLTGLGQHFSDAMILVNGVSTNAAATVTWLPRNDAGTGGTPPTAFSISDAAYTIYGVIRIPLYRGTVGTGGVEIYQATAAFGSPNVGGNSVQTSVVWNITGGIGSMVLTSTQTFDAGSFDLYLR